MKPEVYDWAVENLGDAEVRRLSGSNRYETSKTIAGFVLEPANGGKADGACIATGRDFPDALAGGALVGTNRSVLLLADPGNLDALEVLADNKDSIYTIYFLGGTGVVPDSVRGKVKAAIGME